jgi:hypothetical protein
MTNIHRSMRTVRNPRRVMHTAIALALFALGFVAQPGEAQQPGGLRLPKSVLQRYVGEWVYPSGETVKLTVSGETLYREVPGQRVPFVPISETLFRLGPVFTAEFVMDKSGGITQILTDGTGVEFQLHRKGSRPAALPASTDVAVNVPRSVLERYVGTYEYIPGQMKRTDLRIVIGLKGDTLIRGMGAEEVLTPLSETRFRVAGTSLMVEFVVDDAGVTQVLGTGGQQMIARLIRKP